MSMKPIILYDEEYTYDKIIDQYKGKIYLITNIINNKKYIGQVKCFISGKKYGVQQRWNKHIRDSKNKKTCFILGNALQKYGIDNFIISTIVRAPLFMINELETYFIKYFNCIAPNGYNIQQGGNNRDHTIEGKRKISKANKFKRLSEEDKKNLKKR